MSLCVDIAGFGVCQMTPPFSVFVITVQQDGFQAWTVYRRYVHFRALSDQLRTVHDITPLPVMQGNVESCDLEFLSHTRGVLHEWFQLIITDQDILRTQSMYHFLCADANMTPPYLDVYWRGDGRLTSDARSGSAGSSSQSHNSDGLEGGAVDQKGAVDEMDMDEMFGGGGGQGQGQGQGQAQPQGQGQGQGHGIDSVFRAGKVPAGSHSGIHGAGAGSYSSRSGGPGGRSYGGPGGAGAGSTAVDEHADISIQSLSMVECAEFLYDRMDEEAAAAAAMAAPSSGAGTVGGSGGGGVGGTGIGGGIGAAYASASARRGSSDSSGGISAAMNSQQAQLQVRGGNGTGANSPSSPKKTSGSSSSGSPGKKSRGANLHGGHAQQATLQVELNASSGKIVATTPSASSLMETHMGQGQVQGQGQMQQGYKQQVQGQNAAGAGVAGVGAVSAQQLQQQQQQRKTISLEAFDIIRVIGKGSFGKVFLVRHRARQSLHALKVLKKDYIIKKNQVEHTKTENSVLKYVRHPYIVGCSMAFQTSDKLFFVLDYCAGGELFFHLGKVGRFDEPRAKFYAAQITLALAYVHSMGIIYRDLKPENVLIDDVGNVRLTDFGLSKEGVSHSSSGATSFCGTPEYIAPEVLLRQGHGRAVDWWSLGALLFEMLSGLPPFYSRNREVMFEKIMKAQLTFPPFVSAAAKDLLAQLLIRDPTKRLGSGERDAADIEDHALFSDIDWEVLATGRAVVPWVPDVHNPLDLKHFDKEFTSMNPSVSPDVREMYFGGSVDKTFAGFSFVDEAAHHAMMSANGVAGAGVGCAGAQQQQQQQYQQYQQRQQQQQQQQQQQLQYQQQQMYLQQQQQLQYQQQQQQQKGRKSNK